MSPGAALLADVCDISMGQAPSGDTYNTEGKGLPLIAGAGDFGDLTPKPTKFTTSPTKISRSGDLILCIRATIGDRNWSDGEYCLGRGVAGLSARPHKLDQKYLWHWLGYATPKLKAKGRGATFLQVNKADIGSMEVPLPPLDEQRRIAAILDKADALRAKRREAIAKLDQLQQSVFVDTFGDPVKNSRGWPIHRICDLLESVKYGSSAKASLEGDVPILRMNNLTYSGEMDLDDLKYITTGQAEEKYLVKSGDILFNRTNSKELVGKTAVYDGPTPMAYAGYLVRGRVLEGHVPEYISAFLNSLWGKAILRNMCKNIVGMANINAKEFGSIELPVPPTHLQVRFQKSVQSIREQKSTLQRHATQLDTLFASLQHRAFSGTL